METFIGSKKHSLYTCLQGTCIAIEGQSHRPFSTALIGSASLGISFPWGLFKEGAGW